MTHVFDLRNSTTGYHTDLAYLFLGVALAGHVRDWIGRTADRLGLSAQGLSYAGAADRDASRGDGREGGQDLAARLRAAWDARQGRVEGDAAPPPPPGSARSLAERLRDAAQGIDGSTLANAAARLQEGREAEERQRVEAAERLKEQERLREEERTARHRDSGMDHSM